MTPYKLAVLGLVLCGALVAGGNGGHAEYVGGTISQIPAGCDGTVQAVDDQYFVFYSHHASWRVPYDRINLIEYGQKVDRRYIAAVIISPLFLLAKKRQHFLTVGYSDEENRADAMRLAHMLCAVYRCPKPVIARVHGDAYAGGMGLVCAADIVVAVQTANFCLSEARLGLMPATIAPYVIRALGEQASRRYFVTAEAFDCATAQRLGVVSEAVSAEELDAAVQRMADALVANSPNAVRECKRLVQDVAGQTIDDALIEDTAILIARIRASEEGRDGVSSFLEKRTPRWRT